MKKLLAMCLTIMPFMAMAQTPDIPNTDTLSGDEGDACKAVLCLSSSSGKTQAECQPPLQRYFAIHAKKWSDTVRQRKDFLSLCPTGDFENKDGYFNDLVNASGRCSAAELNASQRQSRTIQQCYHTRNGEVCNPIVQWRISNALPNYCQALFNNSYTDLKSTYYSGNPVWQTQPDFSNHLAGKWVDG